MKQFVYQFSKVLCDVVVKEGSVFLSKSVEFAAADLGLTVAQFEAVVESIKGCEFRTFWIKLYSSSSCGSVVLRGNQDFLSDAEVYEWLGVFSSEWSKFFKMCDEYRQLYSLEGSVFRVYGSGIYERLNSQFIDDVNDGE